MLRIKLFVISFCIIILSLSACTNAKTKNELLCCHQYTSKDEKYYCLKHRSAASKYILIDSEVSINTRKEKLKKFKVFYKTVENCKSVGCIEARIENDFKGRYIAEHERAEKNTKIKSGEFKVRLILCGFQNGIFAMEKYLNG
ncbi:MAG: hypothetical protein OEV44_03935 [Spirochaetota bacterium]|nr:hypothetical protein [Spirochaetota bacterium]